MNYHYSDSLIIAEDLTNKIDKIIEERYNDGREAGKSDLMDVLDKIMAEIEECTSMKNHLTIIGRWV